MKKILLSVTMILLSCLAGLGQSTAFTYQGKLSASGVAANGTYDFEFRLYDSLSAGTQIGAVQTKTNVLVTEGIFTVNLDFGGQFPGAGRFLDISVRQTGGGAYTLLIPRQPITSSPYSIQTINSQMLGGVAASQYVQTGDPRLIDARPPTPGSINYIQNTTTPQAASNFNVTGNGTAASLTTNTTLAVAGSSPPANAPAGQSRLYFDNATNKLKISENGAGYVNLVGATGVSGSGTLNNIPLWSAGTTLGNSLISQSATDIFMPSRVVLAPAANNVGITFGSPNIETGMTFSNQVGNRADIRYNGTLTLANTTSGVPAATRGLTIDPLGNVGVGLNVTGVNTAANGKLHIVGGAGQPGIFSSTDNRGVWGRTLGTSFGVYGDSESGTGIGVQGVSTSNIGTAGLSTSSFGIFGASNTSSGVRGDSNATSVSVAGVHGVSNGTGGVGVRGDGTTGIYGRSTAGVGVTGESSSASGYGVFASNTNGQAIYANGNAGQAPDKGGFVKAMIYVGPAGNVIRCYNSQRTDGGASLPPSGNTGCGFSVSVFASLYTVTFDFFVGNRFASATGGRSGSPGAFVGGLSIGGNSIAVNTYVAQDGGPAPADFMLIVY